MYAILPQQVPVGHAPATVDTQGMHTKAPSVTVHVVCEEYVQQWCRQSVTIPIIPRIGTTVRTTVCCRRERMHPWVVHRIHPCVGRCLFYLSRVVGFERLPVLSSSTTNWTPEIDWNRFVRNCELIRSTLPPNSTDFIGANVFLRVVFSYFWFWNSKLTPGNIVPGMCFETLIVYSFHSWKRRSIDMVLCWPKRNVDCSEQTCHRVKSKEVARYRSVFSCVRRQLTPLRAGYTR